MGQLEGVLTGKTWDNSSIIKNSDCSRLQHYFKPSCQEWSPRYHKKTGGAVGHAMRPRTRKWLFQPAGQARCTEHVCLDPVRRHYSRGQVREGPTDPGAGQEKATDSEIKQRAQKRAQGLVSTLLWPRGYALVGTLPVWAGLSLRKEILDDMWGCNIMKWHQSCCLESSPSLRARAGHFTISDLSSFMQNVERVIKSTSPRLLGNVWDCAYKTLSAVPGK